MKNIILFLIIILLSCNGQEENANDYFIYLKTCDHCSKQDQYKIQKISNEQIYFDTAHCHLCGVQFNKPVNIGKYYDILIAGECGHIAYKIPDSAWVVNDYNALLIQSMYYYVEMFKPKNNKYFNTKADTQLDSLIKMCKEYLSNRK